MAAISTGTALALMAASTIAASGITAGVSAATQPDAPKMPKDTSRRDARRTRRAGDLADERARKQALAAFGRSDSVLSGGGRTSLLGA